MSKNASKNGADFGQLGDCAKLREALKLFAEYSDLVCRMGVFNRYRLVKITTKARAALAATEKEGGDDEQK